MIETLIYLIGFRSACGWRVMVQALPILLDFCFVCFDHGVRTALYYIISYVNLINFVRLF